MGTNTSSSIAGSLFQVSKRRRQRSCKVCALLRGDRKNRSIQPTSAKTAPRQTRSSSFVLSRDICTAVCARRVTQYGMRTLTAEPLFQHRLVSGSFCGDRARLVHASQHVVSCSVTKPAKLTIKMKSLLSNQQTYELVALHISFRYRSPCSVVQRTS